MNLNEFKEIVKAGRKLQKKWFATNRTLIGSELDRLLNLCHEAESKIDKAIIEIENQFADDQQPKLF